MSIFSSIKRQTNYSSW